MSPSKSFSLVLVALGAAFTVWLVTSIGGARDIPGDASGAVSPWLPVLVEVQPGAALFTIAWDPPIEGVVRGYKVNGRDVGMAREWRVPRGVHQVTAYNSAGESEPAEIEVK